VLASAVRLIFDGFEIDVDGGRLLRDGIEVPLERRALDMLCYLAAHPQRLVRKEELVAEVWHARALSPGVLANTAAKLRRALGQVASARAPIETVHGRGYRFHAQLRPAQQHDSGSDLGAAGPADPFVGRARVMETLDSALSRARSGQGQLVLLVGEAGIGKTRSLGQLAERARAQGFSVWEGAAYDGAGAPAYWPWIEVLRAARRELSQQQWEHHLPAGCTALPRVVPELCAGSVTSADAQSTRFQLFDELTRLLASASAEQPRMIALDDLHWADLASLELLAHAAHALAKRPLLLAASLRERDAALGPQQLAAIGRLSRRARRIALRGLSRAEIAELLGRLHGAAGVEAGCAEILAQRTQGNPFFILQMLELLAQQGKRPDAASLKELEAPAPVQHVIQQRLAGLPEEARAALAAAAAIGQEFDAPLLAELLDTPLPQLLAAIDVARQLGVIARRAPMPQRFEFGHALLRETLYEELSLPRAGALHARLARLLGARAEAGDARQLGEVARHFLAAVPSELEPCLAACQRAADAAREASGFEAAAELLSRALHKLLSEGGDPRTGCEHSLTLGTDQYYAGDLEGAWRTLAQGAARARTLPEAGDMLARFVFRLLDCAEAGAGDETQVRALLEEALEAVGDAATRQRAALLAHRAELACELPFVERLALLDQADALAREHRDAELMLEVANCSANLRDPTQPEHGLLAAQRLRALLRQYPASIATARRQMWAFSADLSEYIYALTAGQLGLADEIAARVVKPGSRPVTLDFLAGLMAAGRALGDGQLDELERRLSDLRELSSRIAAGLSNVARYYLVLLADARGNLPALRALVSAERPPVTPSRNARSAILVFAWFYVKLGMAKQARALLAEVSLERARMPVQYGDLGVMCNLAETYAALEDQAGARRLHALLLPHAAANAVGPGLEYQGSVEHYLGLLAGMLGRGEEAEQRLERAQQMNERLGMPLALARTRALRERFSHLASRRP
jgi:DNA-binding winged helix-turn-helix (wHTH) protein